MSRNNDIDGYWALGVLRADHPAGSGVTQVSLVNRSAVPATRATELAAQKFGERLQTMLAKHGLAQSDISAADISIEFDATVALAADRTLSYGEPYRCTVTLLDRLGKIYAVTDVGRCARHNAATESRSDRAGNTWPSLAAMQQQERWLAARRLKEQAGWPFERGPQAAPPEE